MAHVLRRTSSGRFADVGTSSSARRLQKVPAVVAENQAANYTDVCHGERFQREHIGINHVMGTSLAVIYEIK